MDWKPIETAPKDGTVIDVWVRTFPTEVGEGGKIITSVEEGERIANARWCEEVHVYLNPFERQVGEACWVEPHYPQDLEKIEWGQRRVTHWMPLPQPPNEQPLDQRLFSLGEEEYEAFTSALDNPPEPPERLKELFKEKSA